MSQLHPLPATVHRYAVYFAPAPGSAHAELGARWLGRDALQPGRAMAPESLGGLGAEARAALCRSARRYGLHATLKPPFELAEGCSVEELDAALHTLAARHTAFELPVHPARLHNFLAWRPHLGEGLAEHSVTQRLMDLASDCVQSLDPFRRSPSAAELQRRRNACLSAGLSAEQEALLQRWGYPFVMEAFRFHLTLSDALDAEQLAGTEAALQRACEPLAEQPMCIDALSLFVEPEPGADFVGVRRYPLQA